MEILFAHLVKLIVIFLGSGLGTLLAFWVGKEASTIPKLIYSYEQKQNSNKEISLAQYEKVSSKSGLYEVLVPSGKTIKLFSSHRGMKVV